MPKNRTKQRENKKQHKGKPLHYKDPAGDAAVKNVTRKERKLFNVQ